MVSLLVITYFMYFMVDFIAKVVTCGNVPLKSSFQKVPRCIYTSTSLYEYRGWDSKAATPTQRRFTWGLRSSEVCSAIQLLLQSFLNFFLSSANCYSNLL